MANIDFCYGTSSIEIGCVDGFDVRSTDTNAAQIQFEYFQTNVDPNEVDFLLSFRLHLYRFNWSLPGRF